MLVTNLCVYQEKHIIVYMAEWGKDARSLSFFSFGYFRLVPAELTAPS